MPQLYIEDFKAGLDTRRSIFTAPAGSLRELVNAHVTRGGELEKRRAFGVFADLPAGTVGLAIARDEVFTFGSGARPAALPAQVRYLQLASPTGSTLVEILDTEVFNGLVYAIGRFDDGNIYHYYDGNRVTDWDDISADLADNAGVAAFLATRLSAFDGISAVASGTVITITGPADGTEFTFSSSAVNGGSVNDQDITLDLLQTGQAQKPSDVAFSIDAGTQAAGNEISAIDAATTALLSAAVPFNTDASTTAADVAAAINSGPSSYTASASAATITVTAPEGTGATTNGDLLTVTVGGDVTVLAESTPEFEFARGLNDEPQIVAAEIVGTFEPQDQYNITINGETATTSGAAVGVGTTLKVLGEKVYSSAQSVVYSSGFSVPDDDPTAPGVPDPTRWGIQYLNSALINLSTQYGGADVLTGLGIYQDQLAIFSQRAIQLYSVATNPDLNSRGQVLINIGALAPKSIIEYGDQDLFFLAESGMRSLRARDSSNLATANDAGVAIDSELRDYMLTLSDQEVASARAIVEPQESRYLLALGDRVYVFSTFPGSRISSWSRYDLGAPVEDWAVSSRQLYARVGDQLLVYGGTSGVEFDSSKVIVDTPYMDAGKPADMKRLVGIDAGVVGQWDAYLYTEPSAPEHRDYLGQLNGDTYGSKQRPDIEGLSSHFRLRLENEAPGPALLGNMVVHFEEYEK